MSEALPWALLERQFNGNKGYAYLKAYLEHQNRSIRRLPIQEQVENGLSYLSILAVEKEYERIMVLKNYNLMFKQNKVKNEIVEFMQLLMDECTHLINFDKPRDTTLIHVLSARDDAYILRDGVHDLQTIWPGKLQSNKMGYLKKFPF